MERLVNDYSTTLTAAFASAGSPGVDTDFPVASTNDAFGDAVSVTGEFRIRIDNELLVVTREGAAAGNLKVKIRGAESTTAAAHASGATVEAVATAGALQAAMGVAGTVHVANYGAKGDGRFLYNATMAAGSAVLTDAAGAFTDDDVGKTIIVSGVAAGNESLVTTILSRQSATQVTLAAAATVASPDPANTKIAVYGTDDTAAIQAASDAAAISGSGTLEYDSKVYIVAGALVRGARLGNSQLTLPHLGSGSMKRLVWKGARTSGGTPQMPFPNSAGTVLVSTLIGQSYHATYGIPSVIGGPTQEQLDGFSGWTFDVEDLTVLTPRNPSLSAFNLECCDAQNRKRVTAGTLEWGYPVTGLETLAISEPTHPCAAGFIDPHTTNRQGAAGVSAEISTWGYYVGIVPNEHSDVFSARIFCTKIAIAARTGTGTRIEGSTHPAKFGQVSMEGCPHGISGWDPSQASAGVVAIPTAKAFIAIDLLDIEDWSDATNSLPWLTLVNHVNDPNGKLYGSIGYSRWSYVLGVFTGLPDLVVNAAPNVAFRQVNSPVVAKYQSNIGQAAIDAILPWLLQIIPGTNDNINVAGTWTSAKASTGSNVAMFNVVLTNNTQALNDEIAFDVTLAKGVYNLALIYTRGSAFGIASIRLNDVEQATLDAYNAATGYDQRAQWIITIPTTGKHRISFKVTGKNASSTSYFFQFSMIQLRRTA